MTLEYMLSTPGVAWLAFAAVLAIVELLIPGIFLVFVAAGAAVTGVITLVFPGLTLWVEVLIFAAASAAAVTLGRSWYRNNPVASADPLLNDRAARLIGEVVPVVSSIEAGRGRVKVGDSEWIACGPDAATGTRVRIVGAQGTSLTVEPVIA